MSELEKVVESTKIKTLIEESNGELIKIQDYEQTSENLAELVKKHDHIQEITKENFEDAKKARLELREARYALQNVYKHNNDVLNRAKKMLKEDNEALIAIIEPAENRIDSGIKAIEQEKEREKAEKERLENERIDKINERLKFFRNLINEHQHGFQKSNIEHLEIGKNQIIECINADEFQEFTYEADALKDLFDVAVQNVQAKIDHEAKLIEEKKKQEEEAEKLQAMKLQMIEMAKSSVFASGNFERSENGNLIGLFTRREITNDDLDTPEKINALMNEEIQEKTRIEAMELLKKDIIEYSNRNGFDFESIPVMVQMDLLKSDFDNCKKFIDEQIALDSELKAKQEADKKKQAEFDEKYASLKPLLDTLANNINDALSYFKDECEKVGLSDFKPAQEAIKKVEALI